jgi:hypothetical protein
MSTLDKDEVLRVLLPALAGGRLGLCPRCCRNMFTLGSGKLSAQEEDARSGGWWPQYPAMSRTDNETRICSPCGNEEALEDALSGHVMDRGSWGPRFLDDPDGKQQTKEKHHE